MGVVTRIRSGIARRAPRLVARTVSRTRYVPSALELRDVDASTLDDAQHYAVFDRPRT